MKLGQIRAATVRFAPSPTGYLHLGGLRTALYNYLLAQNTHGKNLLRIENTDQTRTVPGAEESLVSTLRWAGISYDRGPWTTDAPEGPFVQTERRAIYDRYVDELVAKGRAYRCFCSSERLDQIRKVARANGSSMTYDRRCLGLSPEQIEEKGHEAHVVRFKSNPTKETQCEDAVYGKLSLPGSIDDFVVRKSDGLPTYHFASVVDDHLMGVSHVLRGEEWISSLPKHLALYEAFGWTPPVFAHLPLLINPDGSKLSKRTGDVAVEQYQERGYEPEALLNFVLLMGWGPEQAQNQSSSEVLSIKEMIEQFSISGINRRRSAMNPSKLDFLNKSHLKLKLADEQTSREVVSRAQQLVTDAFPGDINSDPAYIQQVLDLMKDRLTTLTDITSLGSFFFVRPSRSDYQETKTMLKKVFKGDGLLLSNTMNTITAILGAESPLTKDTVKSHLTDTILIKHVNTLLRFTLTAQKMGPDIVATARLLGKDECLDRLHFVVNSNIV